MRQEVKGQKCQRIRIAIVCLGIWSLPHGFIKGRDTGMGIGIGSHPGVPVLILSLVSCTWYFAC